MRGICLNLYGSLLRKEPNNYSKKAGYVDFFEYFNILEKNPDWSLVECDGGFKGYIKTKDCAEVYFNNERTNNCRPSYSHRMGG